MKESSGSASNFYPQQRQQVAAYPTISSALAASEALPAKCDFPMQKSISFGKPVVKPPQTPEELSDLPISSQEPAIVDQGLDSIDGKFDLEDVY